MRQRWWIGVVAVVGIVLAVLLFPRPDTGEDVPPADPRNRTPLDFKSPGPRQIPPGAAINPTIRRDPSEVMPAGPRPSQEHVFAARNRPEVVYAGKVIAPWSAIRYVLLKQNSPEARALADELGDGIMADLRQIRTADEVEAPWVAVEPRMAAAADKVAASAWGEEETIVKSLERYRSLVQEFHEVKENGGQPPSGGETPAPPGVTPTGGGADDAQPGKE